MISKEICVDKAPPRFSIVWAIPFVDYDLVINQFIDQYDKEINENLLDAGVNYRTYNISTIRNILNKFLYIESIDKNKSAKSYCFELLENSPEELYDKLILTGSSSTKRKSSLDISTIKHLSIFFKEFKKCKVLQTNIFGASGCYDNNELYSVKINMSGDEIKILASEYIMLDVQTLNECIYGNTYKNNTYPASHMFTPSDVIKETVIADLSDTDNKLIYESALLDGCTDEQAIQIVLGCDILSALDIPKPLGWYKPTKDFIESLGL
jgi:hypothetical protein